MALNGFISNDLRSLLYFQASVENARFNAWSTYQRESAERLEVLNNDWKHILKNYLRKQTSSTKRSEAFWNQIASKSYDFSLSLNVMQDIISKVARLYIEPPIREWVIGDKNAQQFADLITPLEDYLNSIEDEALRKSLACGGVLGRPTYQEGEWRFDIYPPEAFAPRANQHKPNELIEVAYRQDAPDNLSNFQSIIVHLSIDPDNPEAPFEKVTYQDGKPVIDRATGTPLGGMGESYPYRDAQGMPYLPVVLYRLWNQSHELINKSVGVDLFDATLRAGAINVRKEWLIRQASHPRIVINAKQKYADADANDFVVPIIVEGDTSESNVQLLEPKPDFKIHFDEIADIFAREANKRGYEAADFIESAQRESGLSMEIKQRNRYEWQQTLINTWKPSCNEMIRKLVLVNNSMARIGVPGLREIDETGHPKIKFVEKNEISIDEINKLGIMLDRGLISVSETIRKIDPNISEAEAEAKAAEYQRGASDGRSDESATDADQPI